jgi:aminopeptidase N
MTRDAEMPGRAFVDLVLASLPGETDSTLLRTLLAQLQTTARLYVAPEHREATIANTVRALRRLAEDAEAGSDAQLQLVTAFAALQTGGEEAAFIRALLDGATTLQGLAVDTEMRWTLLTALAAVGAATAEEVDAERERDNTATGRERAAQARASMPTAEAKAEAWAAGVERDDLPNSLLDAYAIGFGRATDPSVLAPYIEAYHAMLLDTWSSRTHAIAETIVVQYYPTVLCSQELRDATQAWLDANQGAPAGLVRLVSENRDAVARGLRAQERDARG